MQRTRSWQQARRDHMLASCTRQLCFAMMAAGACAEGGLGSGFCGGAGRPGGTADCGHQIVTILQCKRAEGSVAAAGLGGGAGRLGGSARGVHAAAAGRLGAGSTCRGGSAHGHRRRRPQPRSAQQRPRPSPRPQVSAFHLRGTKALKHELHPALQSCCKVPWKCFPRDDGRVSDETSKATRMVTTRFRC